MLCGLHRFNFQTAQLAPFCIIHNKMGEVAVIEPETILVNRQWTIFSSSCDQPFPLEQGKMLTSLTSGS